jgi:hypothetical protein
MVSNGESKVKMPIAKISNEGLSAMAVLVALLWCLILANHRIVHRAEADASQAVLELRRLRLESDAGPWKSHEKPARRPVASAPRASWTAI